MVYPFIKIRSNSAPTRPVLPPLHYEWVLACEF